jgi:hypothetical protein
LVKFDIPWSTRVQSAYLSQPSAINTIRNTKINSTKSDFKGMNTLLCTCMYIRICIHMYEYIYVCLGIYRSVCTYEVYIHGCIYISICV